MQDPMTKIMLNLILTDSQSNSNGVIIAVFQCRLILVHSRAAYIVSYQIGMSR